MDETIVAQIEALERGRAFADLSHWRKVLVRGAEALAWLNDLLSAELAGLGPGVSRRSLLLSPTGRIRADITVAATGDGLLLIQDPQQPGAVDRTLAPYVLSSDVEMADRTADLTLLGFPGGEPPGDAPGEVLRPSSLGPGADLIASAAERDAARRVAATGLAEAGPEALEAWRVGRGAARFGVDLTEGSLPHEALLDAAIAYDKGCFLGQEAVAKVRNLGHPAFVLVAARARGPASAGDTVLASGADAGVVTSAVPLPEGATAAIVRVRWAARDAVLHTASGTELMTSGPVSGADAG